MDFTAFYAGTKDPLRGNYEDYDAESYGADEDYEDYEYIMTIVTKTDGRMEIEKCETHPLVLLVKG